MAQGTINAILTELFLTQIRNTAMAIPYNIGHGWVGGFLPSVAFALITYRGDIYFGLWYSVIFASIGFIVYLFFIIETAGIDLGDINNGDKYAQHDIIMS